ncbi:MAG: hypothetical protein ACE5ER_09130, partial [Nitrospinaceae bacterium]
MNHYNILQTPIIQYFIIPLNHHHFSRKPDNVFDKTGFVEYPPPRGAGSGFLCSNLDSLPSNGWAKSKGVTNTPFLPSKTYSAGP